jgi:hypothetical protein
MDEGERAGPMGVEPMNVIASMSLADEVRATFFEVNARKASDMLGMSIKKYRLIKKLLILKDRRVLSKSEEARADNALQYLETFRHEPKHFHGLGPAYEMVDDILKQYWKRGTSSGEYIWRGRNKDTVKAKKKLQSTLFAIRETCANNEEIEIPLLTNDERAEYRELLLESANALLNLRNKIKGEDR